MNETVTVLLRCGNSVEALIRTLESIFSQITTYSYKIIVYGDSYDKEMTDVLCHFGNMHHEQLVVLSPSDVILSNDPEFPDEIVTGRYIAELSAGDVWPDSEKLQKQVSYLEDHPKCSFVFSNSYDTDRDGHIIRSRQPVDKSRIFNARELMYADKDYYAAASVLYRNDLYDLVYDPCATGIGDFSDAPFRAYTACGAVVYGFTDFMVNSVKE